MPSERFFNLKEEKKKRIIDASLKEFSRVSFDEISINRIIQDAEISRGSFYQYFEDKRDLQTYLLTDFSNQIKSSIQTYMDEKRGDMFQFFEDGLYFLVELGMKSPYHDVCKNAFAQMGHCNGCQNTLPFEESEKTLFYKMIDFMKREYYEKYDTEDVTLVLELLLLLLKEAVLRIFLFNEAKEEVLNRYLRKVDIIKIGFESKEKKDA